MRVSIIDLSPVQPGEGPVEGFRDSVELARFAERLGYTRFWVAEHHARGGGAVGSNPEVLIARIAALTSRIRVGSGAVLLNHYSAFKVAEVFQVLHAMSPGRIDLGLGRASGPPVVDLALQRDRSRLQYQDDHAEQLAEVVAWMDDAFPPGHPFAEIGLHRRLEGRPQVWVLGSSPASAMLAGRLGLRYCFAGFISPNSAVNAGSIYRSSFRASPSPSGIQQPLLALGMNVSCGETDADGDRLRATVEVFYRRLRAGIRPGGPLPDPEAAIAELGAVPEPSRLRDGSWPQHISGGQARIRALLEEMATAVGADEVIIQDLIARRADRLRSYELIAEGFELQRSAPGAD